MDREQHTRTTSLYLGNILLAETKLTVDTDDVLSDGTRSHSVGIVGNTTESCGTLASGERLPPGLGATSTGVD